MMSRAQAGRARMRIATKLVIQPGCLVWALAFKLLEDPGKVRGSRLPAERLVSVNLRQELRHVWVLGQVPLDRPVLERRPNERHHFSHVAHAQKGQRALEGVVVANSEEDPDPGGIVADPLTVQDGQAVAQEGQGVEGKLVFRRELSEELGASRLLKLINPV